VNRRTLQTLIASANAEAAALKTEADTLSQTRLGMVILVVLIIVVLLLTGRSEGGWLARGD
jgi:hypothetical protein